MPPVYVFAFGDSGYLTVIFYKQDTEAKKS